MMPNAEDEITGSLDREKWEVENKFRERELAIKEGELELQRQDQKGSGWRNPLVVAILAATAAAAGNAVVAVINGHLERDLEAQKSEQTRILEMIKTGDPDKAADNLDFLLKTGLIDDAGRAQRIQRFLDSRTPGNGPSLPTASGAVSSEIKPGVERWSVRTGADADSTLVSDKVVPTTIHELAAFPPPDSRDPRFQEHRFKPVEITLYRVEGTLTSYKEEMSGDYHLILTDDSGETMIAAAPNPDPAFVSPSSRWAREIAAVHKVIQDRLHPTARFSAAHVRVRVTGLGYFSFPHGVRGEAKNAVQLHPVIAIEFL
jgi:hypothetical protein